MDRARLLKRAGEHCEYLQAVTDILAEGQPSYKIATDNLRTSRRIIEDLCTALREEAT